MTPEQAEAQRRTAMDGIPRYITDDGRIMKCDWELSADLLNDDLKGEAMEEHIAKLMEQQNGKEI